MEGYFKTASLRLRRAFEWLFAPSEPPLPRDGKPRIALIKQGNFSHINEAITAILRREFPGHELVVLDVRNDVLRFHKLAALWNFASVLRWFGRDILSGRRTIRECYFLTPFLFHRIPRLLRKKFAGCEQAYSFTFATQSLYDASVTGIPHFVYTDHTHMANVLYPSFNAQLLLPERVIELERAIYEHARKTFVAGPHILRSLAEHYGIPPDRDRCVFAGSNIEPADRPPANDNYQNQRILFVGVDWKRKGGHQLLEAFRLVRETLPFARLAVVGCRPWVKIPNVDVFGQLPKDAVRQQLRRSSLFCFSSLVEPFGIAPIEAFMHKLPVVASPIGAMPAIVKDGVSGTLVDTNNPRAFADAILDFLTQPEKCRKFGEAGFEIAIREFTWEAVGRRIREEIAASLEAGSV